MKAAVGRLRMWASHLGCHGIPERCFTYRGEPMSVCARCIGATIGQVAAIVVAVIWTLPPWWVNAALLALMLIDWGVQEYAGILSTNRRRLMTGLAGGFGFTAIAIRLLMWIVPIIWNAVF